MVRLYSISQRRHWSILENISYIFGIIERIRKAQNENLNKNENKNINSHFIHSVRNEF